MGLGNLTQSEADSLRSMEKKIRDNRTWSFPGRGGKIEIPMTCYNHKEQFSLDISRGSISFNKVKYQERARSVEVLVRLDIGGAGHRNPDDSEVASSHIHIYREGYGDKWAIDVPAGDFTDLANMYKTLDEFMVYCNITKPPKFKFVQQELPL